MNNKLFTILCSSLIFANTLNGQDLIDYDMRFGLFTNWGISSLGDNSELNQFLINNDYPEISRLQGTFNFIELESQYKKMIIRLQDYRTFVIKGTMESIDQMTNFSLDGNVGWFGYEIFSNDKFHLYPIVGYESSTATLKLSTPNGNVDFENFVNSPNKLTLSKKIVAFRGELCIRSMLNQYSGFSASLGYRLQNSEGQWTYYDKKLENGPSLVTDGIYLNVGLQINTKIFRTLFEKRTNR